MSSLASRPALRPALRLLAGAALIALAAGPALAAEARAAKPQADPDAETEVDGLVVEGTRNPPGSVIGDITPEVVLSPREIRAYGAADISELLTALAPQLTSGQGDGRPVVLLNGGRVSGFQEIRDLPTEAIARVDILPEEVSLKYGYPAEQKVVNIVLRQRFRATLLEAQASTPTQPGGGETVAGHAAVLHILQGRRMMVDAKASQTSPILESDRDITGGDGPNRSLQPDSTDTVLNAVYARPFDNGVSASVNGTFEDTDSKSRLGLSPLGPEALTRRSRDEDARLAGSGNGALAGWQWSVTGSVERDVGHSSTDRVLGLLPSLDETRSATTTGLADIVLNKALWRVPAGQVSATLTARATALDFDSSSLRGGVSTGTELDRSIGELRTSIDLPLTRAGEGPGKAIGKLSANMNFGLQQLSDFGSLHTVGGGLNWTPVKPVRILAAYSRTDLAPTINQLGDPATVTPGVRIYDLARGDTVEVTQIGGGNRDLDSGRRDMAKLGITYKPWDKVNLTFQADYVATRIHDAIVAFPSASTQVEAAFPDRFTRDAAGDLIQIDARPVNFAEHDRQELRWGFTYSRPVGPQPTPAQIAALRQRFEQERAAREKQQQQAKAGKDGHQAQGPPDGPPPEGGPPPDGPPPPSAGGDRGFFAGGPGGGPGGPGGPGGGGPGGGRGGFGGFGGGPRSGVFQVGLYHTIAFQDEVTIRPGLPKLDLLDGAALGSGGGSPRNQVDLQANYTRGGLGVAMNASWKSGTEVEGAVGGDSLRFSDMTTVNLRLFADLGLQPYARTHRWLRGARATLSVNNLFDERQTVKTSAGVTPISYQPDLLDPVGRSVKLTIRKLIF